MRKIINSTIISLDGVIDDPGRWSLPYFGADSAEFASALNTGSDALLMGRRTYEGFAASWPGMEQTGGEFAVRMNTMPKYVVSTTLTDPAWHNTTVISANAVDEIRALKQRPGRDILVYGYGPVTRLLVEHGLLDELYLWVHPVQLGTGKVLFHAGSAATWQLAGVRPLSSGVVILSYRPA